MSNALNMKKLRERRKKNNKCQRCGKPLINNICYDCRKYRENRRNTLPKKQIIKTPLPKLKIWSIKNRKLYNCLERKGLTSKDLATMTGVHLNTAARWMCKRDPSIKNQILVNEVLGEKIYDVSDKRRGGKMNKSDRHAVGNEFFINAEKILFMTIIGLMERKAIRTNLLGEGEFIDKLVLINDEKMQSYMRTFNQLSPRLKQSIITGLRIRLQDYVNKED